MKLHQEDETSELVEKLAGKFIANILKPLNNVDLAEPKRNNFFILIDGIDDLLLLRERLLSPQQKQHEQQQEKSTKNSETNSNIYQNNPTLILEFLNRVFLFFPHWLNLIVTSRRTTEKNELRKHLTNIKYDRLIMDKCVNLSTSFRPSEVHANQADALPRGKISFKEKNLKIES